MAKKVDKRLKLLLERIKTRFLKPEFESQQVGTLKDILDLPVFMLKDFDKMSALAVKKHFKIETIGELAKLDSKDPFETLVPKSITDPKKRAERKTKILESAMGDFTEETFNLGRNIIIAQMISQAWEKREAYIDEGKKDTKILVLGLDNAGKTAIISGLGQKLGWGDLGKLKPTKGVERKKVGAKGINIFVWDLGGQVDYRTSYLEQPEKFFLGTNMVIYVIDMQDPNRFNESIEYFQKILDILRSFGESPYLLIFLHKSDPDIVDEPEYKLNLEFIKDKLLQIIEPEGEKSTFDYDMFPTSIFNFSSEPEFSKTVKDLMASRSINDPVIGKVEGLGQILDQMMNTVISLASNLNEQINAINQRIGTMETYLQGQLKASAAQSQFAPAAVQAPPPLATALQRPAAVAGGQPQMSVRQTIMEELKVLFQKRRNMAES
jgi:hypothetical protein